MTIQRRELSKLLGLADQAQGALVAPHRRLEKTRVKRSARLVVHGVAPHFWAGVQHAPSPPDDADTKAGTNVPKR